MAEAHAQSSTSTLRELITITIPSDHEDPAKYISHQIGWELYDLFGKWNKQRPFIIHLKTTQGTGKSVGGMETLHYQAGPAAVFGPRHADIQEDTDIKPLRDIFSIHFEGKDRACLHSDYKGQHHKVHPRVSQNYCQGCEYKNECLYWTAYEQQRANETQSYTGVHQHLQLHPEVLDQWQAINSVGIDESPWDTIVEQTEQISLTEVKFSREIVESLLDRKGVESYDDLLQQIYSTLDLLVAALQGEHDDVARLFSEWNSIYTECEERGAIEPITETISRRFADSGNAGYTDVVRTLFESIPEIERAWERAKEQTRALPMNRPPKALWKLSEETLSLRWMKTDTLEQIARQKPVVVMATEMPSELVGSIFDLPVVTVTDEFKPEVDILQLETKAAGVTQLKKDTRLWDNLLELTTLALRQERLAGNRVFIAVKKEFEDRLRDSLIEQEFEEGQDFKIGHYYGLTGSNQYEECDAVVLFGKPQLRDEDVSAKWLLTGVDEDTFQYEKREGELRDALHRIRPVRKDGVRAYIWTKVPNFESDFTGDYHRVGIPDARKELNTKINRKEKAEEIREQIIEYVRTHESEPTATDMNQDLPWRYQKIKRHREELINEGRLNEFTDSKSDVGRPSKKFTVSEALSN